MIIFKWETGYVPEHFKIMLSFMSWWDTCTVLLENDQTKDAHT